MQLYLSPRCGMCQKWYSYYAYFPLITDRIKHETCRLWSSYITYINSLFDAPSIKFCRWCKQSHHKLFVVTTKLWSEVLNQILKIEVYKFSILYPSIRWDKALVLTKMLLPLFWKFIQAYYLQKMNQGLLMFFSQI